MREGAGLSLTAALAILDQGLWGVVIQTTTIFPSSADFKFCTAVGTQYLFPSHIHAL